MTAITIRRLPPEAKQRLRMRAAAKGTSMESEARSILLAELENPVDADASWIGQLIQIGTDFGGVDVPEIADEPATHADFHVHRGTRDG